MAPTSPFNQVRNRQVERRGAPRSQLYSRFRKIIRLLKGVFPRGLRDFTGPRYTQPCKKPLGPHDQYQQDGQFDRFKSALQERCAKKMCFGCTSTVTSRLSNGMRLVSYPLPGSKETRPFGPPAETPCASCVGDSVCFNAYGHTREIDMCIVDPKVNINRYPHI